MSDMRARVTKIVDDLFRNGQGDEAHRLVLTSMTGRDLGGWCRQAMVDRIVDGLSSPIPVDQHPGAPGAETP